MPEQEPTLWGIHGGRAGQLDGLFLKGKSIAIGWGKPAFALDDDANAALTALGARAVDASHLGEWWHET